MNESTNTKRILLVLLGLFVLVLVAGLFCGPIYGTQTQRAHWLENYTNGPVQVTFIVPPPNKELMVTCRLIAVEQSGVVLRMANESNKFYPYSNITCIDPK